ncbi:hypothetical protein [Psychroserpens sp.]|uniref:hypothetical protein n=1 Tax=Psychroserpens sp. TaxID=2020870 RepID=UPI001B229043|nr:hypothetical protein [Psychroserpens sp.]MBO6607489.1 hypothetical protein [Psychroserpens sp.]MBO6632787.1 hypothetical protein [Psychroserpens sp.]MBO6654433.1 hypothetical protein [Psychroserpens sp.]MBO6681218.1 hypothetical protein [Psychroserpens sp.]MBO6749825.1 hypothetical protein [Psychroserpens sp.]
MTKLQKILWFVLLVLGVFLCIALWYKVTYSMDVAESYEIHASASSKRLLIATQGSDFKDSVVQEVVTQFKADSLAIKVIDVSGLAKIDPNDYTALLLIHTWENWKPPKEIEKFIHRTKINQDKIVVITTSGDGSYHMDGMDAITGPSKPENIRPMAEDAIKRLQSILERTP